MNALEGAGFIALGFIAGGYGSLVGVGGGLLIVPILLLSHVAPKDAAGTSMVVVLANAASGSVSYLRQRRVDIRSAIVFAIAGLPGALLGGLADQYVPRKLFSLLFGTFLLFVGVRLFLKPGKDAGGEAAVVNTRNTAGFQPVLAAGIGLVAGFLASLFGIGGGIVFVPSLAYLFGFPAHIATATSTFIIALTAIFGTASHAYYHDVLWGPAIALAIGAVGGAQIGARIAPRVPVLQLMRLFSIAVLFAALWLLYKARM